MNPVRQVEDSSEKSAGVATSSRKKKKGRIQVAGASGSSKNGHVENQLSPRMIDHILETYDYNQLHNRVMKAIFDLPREAEVQQKAPVSTDGPKAAT